MCTDSKVNQFTVEVESNGCTFLDALLEHEEDGSVSTTTYRKPIHTDRLVGWLVNIFIQGQWLLF